MRSALSDRFRSDPVAGAVVAVTVAALLARLVLLGDRVAHFDEARVAYWALEYFRTGDIHYRYITHGPFVQHVDAALFSLLGANDFVARLPVALVGGVLPLAALLFRRHLRASETVALALFLAANPILLYYSRFLRSTVLVAGFTLVALGAFLRFLDSRRSAWLYLGVAFVAFAFAAKENAAVYILTWLGAGALVVDAALFRPREYDSGRARLAAVWGRVRERHFATGASRRRLLRKTAIRVGVSAAVFAVVILFFYAPRTSGSGVGLWNALGNPARFPALVEATIDDIATGYGYWFGGASDAKCHKDNLIAGYACFLGRFLEISVTYAAPLSAFAVIGFLVERYGTFEPRRIVLFQSYAGFASVLGYPLGTDIWGSWIIVNALVPLAFPAAVGLALVYRRGREAFADDDRASTAIAAVLLLLVVGQTATVAVSSSYLHPASEDNDLVQYAQPGEGLDRGTLRTMRRATDGNDGVDVLFYGEYYVDGDASAARNPACVKWFNGLPYPWYVGAWNASVACAQTEAELDRTLESGANPPVVIARTDHEDVLTERFPGYRKTTYAQRLYDYPTVVLVDEDRAQTT